MSRALVAALAWLCVAAISALIAAAPIVTRADPQPALDRQLVERMTRALESQVRATEALTHAVERCGR